MLGSLEELYTFVSRSDYDIYTSDEERIKLKAVPTIWKSKKFIKRKLVEEHGFCYPFIYDIVGLHKLYHMVSTETDKKIDAIIEYISTDEFHHTISEGYGILISGDKKHHAQGVGPEIPRLVRCRRIYGEHQRSQAFVFRTVYFKNIRLHGKQNGSAIYSVILRNIKLRMARIYFLPIG